MSRINVTVLITSLSASLLLQLQLVSCLDRHGNPHELKTLIDLEASCPGAAEFYGTQDPLELSRHPVSLYGMYKRWVLLKESNITCYNSTEIYHLLPDPGDLREMGLNLIRLQFTYNLSIPDLLNGDIRGRISPWPLHLTDCLRIADMNHEDLKPDGFQKWHKACTTMEGYDAALEVPSYEQKAEQYNKLIELIKNLDVEKALKAKPEAVNWLLRSKRVLLPDGIKQLRRYIQLCAEGSDPHVFQNGNNKCHLDFTQSNPMSPKKVEVLADSPVVMIIHDAIGDNHISRIKQATLDRLGIPQELSTAVNLTFSNSARTGKIAFITDQDPGTGELVSIDPDLVHEVKKNSASLTGLSTEGAAVEMLQVVSYGIGGQYEPHRDAFGINNVNINVNKDSRRNFHDEKGDRIATLIYYLEDLYPANGGATVFPDLGIAAFPEKGSALFWYNLHRNGLLHMKSVHAGCPVLHGTKWISNHWFRERNQEFTRPCDIVTDAIDASTLR